MADDGWLNLDMKVSKQNEKEDMIAILQKLRPWKKESIQFEKLKGGIINQMYCCWSSDEEKSSKGRVEKIAVRLYLDPEAFSPDFIKDFHGGEEMPDMEDIFDHSQEIRNFKKLKGTGLGPELLAVFKNGLCYRYLHGETLNCSSIRSEKMIPYVTKLLANIHTLPMSTEGRTWNMEDIKKSVKCYPPRFEDPQRTQRLLELLPDQAAVLKEIEFVQEMLKTVESPIIFCHNDSKGENFIWDKQTNTLTMIDWEHSFNNTQAAEVGSHFVVYNDVADSKPNQYPDPEFQKRWIRMYLQHWFEATGKNKNDVTDIDVERLYVNANKQAQNSRLLIGIGCLELVAQGIFDCFEFCLQMLKDYLECKDFVKNLVMPIE